MNAPASRHVSGDQVSEIAWQDPLIAFSAFADTDYALLLHDGQNGRARLFAFPDQIYEGEDRAVFDRLAAAGRRLQTGGMLAGLFGYDLAGAFEALPEAQARWPHVAFGRYPAWAEFDQTEGRILIHGTGTARERLAQTLERAPVSLRPTTPPAAAQWAARWNRTHYLDQARRAIDYVHAGDVFQVNLSQAFDARLESGDTPFEVFRRLCEASPAPHAAYLRLDADRVILTNSPERFLSLKDRTVEARPIKGTRPRSPDGLRDQALAAELSESVKDRAENLMIVDLMRNDLSRVCRPGSVNVPTLCAVESYANVHHLVSVVEGVLDDERDAFDLIGASFPPGSITGAPKVRAMEIIHALEGEARGAYCGALGWIDGQGDMDLNVMIRTAALRADTQGWRASVRSGGGIVADSDPESEFEETLTKVSALKAALTGRA